MHILILGAGGFLGRAVQHQAVAGGHVVTAAARRVGEGCEVLDVADTAKFLALLDRCCPDAIINCAARVTFEPATLAAQYAVNCLAPATAAAWCAAKGRHLVQASSAAVAGTACREISGTTPAVPDTDYGRAKHLAEEMIAASGAAAACVRFGGIFGNPGPAHLGLNKAIAAARAGVLPTVIATGRARRNYLHVEDAARVLVHCAVTRAAGVLAAGGRDILTVAEMMTRIAARFLDCKEPAYGEGPEAADQVVLTSPGLPAGGGFDEGLERCR